MRSIKLSQKLFLLLFGLTVFFLLLEAGLRICGYVYNSYRIGNNRARNYADNPVVLLCLGDSYTFGTGADKGFSYPEQLEKMLYEDHYSGYKFKVYNCGVPSLNSSQMLKRLPEYLDKYKPNIVLIMVGLNNRMNLSESNYFLFEEGKKDYFDRIDAFLDNSRSYKLLKVMIESLQNRVMIEQEKSRNLKKSGIGGGNNNHLAAIDKMKSEKSNAHFYLGQKYLVARRISLAKEEFEKAIEINPDNYLAFYGLGSIYACRGPKFKLAVRMLKEAIKINPEFISAYNLLWQTYWQMGENELALQAIREKLKLDPYDADAREILKNGLPYLNKKNIFTEMFEYDLENAVKLLKEKRIKVILLNYPFEDENDGIREKIADKWQVLFVDNRASFFALKSAKDYKNEKYFAEDGHCNNNGYHVIAKNIYKVLNTE